MVWMLCWRKLDHGLHVVLKEARPWSECYVEGRVGWSWLSGGTLLNNNVSVDLDKCHNIRTYDLAIITRISDAISSTRTSPPKNIGSRVWLRPISAQSLMLGPPQVLFSVTQSSHNARLFCVTLWHIHQQCWCSSSYHGSTIATSSSWRESLPIVGKSDDVRESNLVF